MLKHTPIVAGLLASSLLSTGAGAATTAELEQRIAELEQTVRILSRKSEVAEEVYIADKARAAPNGRVKATLDGVSLVSADNQVEVKLKALAQFDGRFGIEDEKDTDTWLMRRVRPTIEASFGKAFFRFTPEFANDDADLVDGYMDYKLPANTLVRAGQFKAPVGLERLQSASALAFNERAFPTELLPNRDRGILLESNLLDRRLTLDLGVTNGTPDGRDASNSDFDGEQELTARAFFEVVPGIGFGIAGTHGEKVSGNDVRSESTTNSQAFLPRYRSPAQSTIFTYAADVAADGDHTRFTPGAYAYVGPFGAMAEYASSEQDMALADVSDSFTNEAAQFTAAWAITGEDESYKGIKPLGEYGGLEAVARWSTLDVDDDVFDAGFADPAKSVDGADQWSLGLNWSITQNFKILTSYSQTSFDGGAENGGDRDDEKLVFTRLQLNY